MVDLPCHLKHEDLTNGCYGATYRDGIIEYNWEMVGYIWIYIYIYKYGYTYMDIHMDIYIYMDIK